MRQAIVRRTAEVGAWLLADEVYQGAERDGTTTPSFWGSYERVIVVNGLSKAYGLPGLRIGWVVAPPGFSGDAWARHDYTTIDRKSTRLNSSHTVISYAVFCLKKKKKNET